MIYVDDHIMDFDLQKALNEVSPQRREYALRYRHERDQRLCVAAFRLLHRALLHEYDIQEPPLFTIDTKGKPHLQEYPHIHFSLSHCREAVGCLLSNEACGLDLEARRPVRESLVRYTMNEEEASLIASAEEPETAFLRLWTRKEAVLKLRGTGIQGDIKDVLAEESISDLELHTSELPRRQVVCSWAIKAEQAKTK